MQTRSMPVQVLNVIGIRGLIAGRRRYHRIAPKLERLARTCQESTVCILFRRRATQKRNLQHTLATAASSLPTV